MSELAAIDRSAEATTSAHQTTRFDYIDGMRGIAATGVAAAHLIGAAQIHHANILGDLPILLDLGRFGVQIFFVLSGFVIAHSVSAGALSWRYLGRFAARRSIRLDMPYWIVIVAEILLLWLSGRILAGYERPLPSMDQVAANALYLQVLLGYDHILPIFWTLCYEVQFYLVFVTALVLLKRFSGEKLAPVVLGVTFALSLIIYVDVIPTVHVALFDDRWFQFALGVITYEYFRGRCSLRAWIIANAACLFAAASLADTEYRVVSLVITSLTSIAIIAATRSMPWRQYLSAAWLLFLGRASYSLYLLHLPIGWRVVVLIRELAGTHYTTLVAMFAFIVGMVASIVAAWMMYRLVETPAIELSRRVGLPRRQFAS